MESGMKDYFESNISLLKKYHNNIYKMMVNISPDPRAEVIISKNGKPNLKVRNGDNTSIFLHEAANPELEIEQFLNMVPENSTGVVTLLGMGLGYTPMALLKNRKNIRHLAVFELEPGIFRHALSLMDLSPMLSDPRLLLSIGNKPSIADVFSTASLSLQLENIHTLTHTRSISVNEKAYEDLNKKIYSYLSAHNLEGSTKSIQGNLLISNRFKQLNAIRHHYLLDSMKQAFSGIPAIIVASGPSLDKNIHILPRASGRAVIITVDSSLPSLLAHGVVPNFVTSIDYDDLTYEKIAGPNAESKGISLVCMPWVGPYVPKRFSAEKVFWTFPSSPLEKWIFSNLAGSIPTGGAGTVAHLNLITAIILGCSPIIFIGQDLAYTFSKDHARHSFLGYGEQMNEAMRSKEDLLLIEGIDGTMLPTRRDFHSYKRSFEDIMAGNPGHYINATAEGANLEGTEILSLERAIDQYCEKLHDIPGCINSHSKPISSENAEKFFAELRIAQKEVKNLESDIQKIDRLIHFTQEEVLKLKNTGMKYTRLSDLSILLQKKMSEIDACNQRLDGAEKIWGLLQEITMDGLRQSERMMHTCKMIEGKPEKYLEWLDKNLQRFAEINKVRKSVLASFDKLLSETINHDKKEKKLLKQLSSPGKKKDTLLKIGKLYFESENYVLAKQVFNDFLEKRPDTAEACFFIGCIAGYQSEYEKVDGYFQKTVRLDPFFVEKIDRFRIQLGDQYLNYARRFKAQDRITARRMIIKGLRFCKDHAGLKNELEILADEDLAKFRSDTKTDAPGYEESMMTTWQNDLEENSVLISAMNKELSAEFYRYYGSLKINENDFPTAMESFQKALSLSPDNPEYHILMTDTLFALNEFEKGLEHLNRAVEINRQYAFYWENIGDNLRAAGQAGDAIIAYENCFISIPENVDSLKKMGDCYQDLGQIEAADEAFRQYEKKLERVRNLAR